MKDDRSAQIIALIVALLLSPTSMKAKADASQMLKNDVIVLPLDRGTLVKFPTREISTRTPWSNGAIMTYRGVSLIELLESHTLKATPIIEARGANGFSSRLPRDDIEEFKPLLATHRKCFATEVRSSCANGSFVPLDTEDFGPIFLVWPNQKTPVGIGPRDNSRWVWFLSELRGMSHSTGRLIDD